MSNNPTPADAEKVDWFLDNIKDWSHPIAQHDRKEARRYLLALLDGARLEGRIEVHRELSQNHRSIGYHNELYDLDLKRLKELKHPSTEGEQP